MRSLYWPLSASIALAVACGGSDRPGGGGGSDAGMTGDGGMTEDGGGNVQDAGCADADSDGVCDDTDLCPGNDDTADADSDGVPDGCDECDAGDDSADADSDGVPDACDSCDAGDDTADADSDGVPDACDVCVGGDDTVDTDADGVPDHCDLCAAGDDSMDTDADGVANACDTCETGDDMLDADSDGVADDCDVCAAGDDMLDADFDGVPDGCDVCAAGDDMLDADSDGVPDACDACAAGDDGADADGDGVADACDACAGSDDGADADSDGVPDDCDTCAGSDDSIDADSDSVPDGCDLCTGGSPSILVYDLDSQRRGEGGAGLLGCSVTRATGSTFSTQVSSGVHDLVIVEAPTALPNTGWDTALQTYVRGGGAAIIATWTNGWTTAITQTFGVTMGAGHDPIAFTPGTVTTPVFTYPFDLSGVSFAPTPPDAFANNGHALTITDGLSYATMTGGQAIVRGNAGRTFANGFLFSDFDADANADGIVDIEALIANQIVAALQSVRNEMYGLPYDYYQWDAASADLLERAVTFRWIPTAFDQPRTVRFVTECADATFDTSTTSPGGAYAGELSSTIAALTYAGFPAGSIGTLADAAAVDAAIGTFDVLVFPEHETCAPSATAWRAVLRRFIHRGGRVIFATPRSSSGLFASALGIFGTGTTGTAMAPYATVSDPFWTGISHPGTLSATNTWNWSGAGLEVLANDSGSDPTVIRYVYRAP